ncbi:Formylglycine-generating sulfatase enzyme [compost metagenome]
MYNNQYVNSGLITGTQWDVILNTIMNKAGMSLSDMTNSSNWGNYANDSLNFSGTSSIYVAASLLQYPFGNTSVTGQNLYKTGTSQGTMKYGIADIAGNLWEWTEEVSNYGGNIATQYRELRGGSFINDGSASPACYRLGTRYSTETITNVGFRVVLYMK